ncbi:MAG: nicotinamide-nucleotide amidohydrolase family protein [Pseudomonadota bacterium]|nr:nicotinamide-nucleotide amidohydrolase family protein [Pseudomonadota bacterium]
MSIIDIEHFALQLGAHLQQQGWYLVTAESCTGGWLAEAVTSVAGSSAWFDRGFVTYSEAAKQEILAVKAATLAQHGAVSEATVLEMVEGALARSRAQVGVAVSGIAGPSGGTLDKPVGTVWIAYALPHRIYAQKSFFSGDRRSIREQAVITALQRLTQGL